MATRRSRSTFADKQAMLARGEPFIVLPAEVAKATATYQTDPEIILGCIIVSGTLDTAAVLRTITLLTHGLAVGDAERAAFDAFRRVWATPTEDERAAVLQWAARIATQKRGARGGGFRWSATT